MRSQLASLVVGLCLATAAGAEAPKVYDSAENVQPLPVGASVPTVAVRTVQGESLDLAARVADRGALLVFYRGGW